MFRSDELAALNRVAQLEDELRSLKSTLAPDTAPKEVQGLWRKVLPFALVGAALAVVAGAYAWSSPMFQTVTRSNSGLAVSVAFRTEVSDVVWESADGTQTFEPFGTAWVSDGKTGGTRSSTVILPNSAVSEEGTTTLRLRYRAYGMSRREVISFNAEESNINFTKSILNGLPQWVAFRDWNDDMLVYFSTLLVYKSALKEIRWGVDDEELTRRVHFTPSKELGIAADDEIYTKVPYRTNRVRVQLVYKDGSESKVKTILRSDSTIP